MSEESDKQFVEAVTKFRGGQCDEVGLSNSNDLLDCKCGAPAKVWLDNSWVLTGCRCCGIASAAYKSFERSKKDWNKMAAI